MRRGLGSRLGALGLGRRQVQASAARVLRTSYPDLGHRRGGSQISVR